MNSNYQVIIIGAGAAGLFCAIKAAKRGRKVLVLDHANKLGKKILMSGGGRCNFTNYSIEPENYIGENAHFCKSALSRFNQWQFLELVEQYKIKYFDKGNGELFCENSSKDIRDLLVNECQLAGVRIQLKSTIMSIESINQDEQEKESLNNQNNFNLQVLSHTTKGIKTDDSEKTSYQCDSLVIATGGLSIPSLGATGFGYGIAKQFKHTVNPTRPGLSPLIFENKWLDKTKDLPGNSTDILISCNNQQFKDAVLFTHKGLSGPSILQISNYWNKGDAITINWLPNLGLDFEDWFNQFRKSRPDIQLKTLLTTQLSQSIADFLCLCSFSQQNSDDSNNNSSSSSSSKLQNAKLKQYDIADILQLKKCLTEWVTYPKDYEGYKVAEVTVGGVNTDEISSKTMQSNKQNGLYFIGEVVDVTGQLGGYNFQWAWASGAAAAEYA